MPRNSQDRANVVILKISPENFGKKTLAFSAQNYAEKVLIILFFFNRHFFNRKLVKIAK
jgi:hypothetical protein